MFTQCVCVCVLVCVCVFLAAVTEGRSYAGPQSEGRAVPHDVPGIFFPTGAA